MTSSVDKSSPSESPTKPPVRADTKEPTDTNLDIDDYFSVQSSSEGRKDSVKAQAAANDLAELFEYEGEQVDNNNFEKLPETINKPTQSENLNNDQQISVEPNISQKNEIENSFSKAKKTSPKNSPVDLYGCDEISTPVDENGHLIQLSNSMSKTAMNPSKNNGNSNPSPANGVKFQFTQNQQTEINSNIAGDLMNLPQQSKHIRTNSLTQSNNFNDLASQNNISHALFNSYTNSATPNVNSNNNGISINENVLSQIMSNGQREQSNYSNVNYLLRRERSLDRTPATENFIENFLMAPSSNMRRSYIVGSNQSPQNNTSSNGSLYNNSNLFNNQQSSNKSLRQSNQQQAPHQQHHRSNSILNTSNPITNLGNSNFNRDYGNGILVGNGLRSSARALSSTSFSTQNFQRDPSATSLKSLSGTHGSNGNINDYQLPGGQTPTQGSSSKVNFIKDLQIRLMDLQKECYYLRCELDSSQQKLTSSMQSIKQFWSPELKRERQNRKEESNKYSILVEQYKILQNQYQAVLENYEQQSINCQQLQLQLEQTNGSYDQGSLGSAKHFMREKSLLKKTINELEMRINTQKQSLTTKDETIKKLFHLIKSASNKIKNNDMYSNNNEAAHYLNELESLTTQLEASNANNLLINERLQEEERKNEQLRQCIQQLQQTQQKSTGFESSDNSLLIKQLENQVKMLQDELLANKNSMQRSVHSSLNENFESTGLNSSHVSPQHIKQNSSLTNSLTSSSQLDLMRSNEKFLKEKVETFKFDLSKKETEIQQLKTKFETCESKEKDLQHYLSLLKESILTKDQQITMQQSEIGDLRTRIRDKENFIEKKNQHLQSIQLEKHQRDSDIGELRDQMDIKERKINVLNRKIENLEEQLKDKEMQLTTIRSKLSTNSVGSGSMYHANILKTLEQKEKIIERMTKEAMALEKQTHTQPRDDSVNEQVETLNGTIKELTEKIDAKNKEIQENQNEVYDLKDEVEMLKTQLLRKDSHVNSLELSLTQKNEEIEMIEEKLTRSTKQQQQQLTFAANAASQQSSSNQHEIENLKNQLQAQQKEITNKEATIVKLSTELASLKEIINEFDKQKQMVKQKLEQQQSQFSQLEKHFEATSEEFESKLKEEKKFKEEQAILFTQEKHKQEDELKRLKSELESLKTKEQVLVNIEDNSKFTAEIDNLKQLVELKEKEKLSTEEGIKKLNERCNHLEEALRESVEITAEREVVFAQQKKKNEAIEDDNKILQEEIKTMQRSLYEQQCEFNRYQEELGQREDRLQKLEEEKVEEMNQLLVTKQELLLSTISEKDAVIGSLECDSDSKKNQKRIQQLNEEKDGLHQQLKELNEKRMKLMQDHISSKDAKHKVKSLTFNNNLVQDVDGITG